MLVLNPHAGGGRGRKIFPAVRELLAGIARLDVRVSEYAGHAFEIGREAAQNGYERILSIGGDGTPFEIVNGLYAEGRPRQAIELGMIPAGTGNSFLRDFSAISWRQAVERILSGRRRRVDLVEIILSTRRQGDQAVLSQYFGRRPDRRHPQADQ